MTSHDNTSNGTSLPSGTYLAIIGLLTSIGALSTDIMLPALAVLGGELGVGNINHTTLVVTVFFLGMALGQLVVGPLSDAYGRKPIVLWGYSLFIAGCVLSFIAESWSVKIIARLLQGLGAAAPRVIAVAIVRDEYKGRAMARIMSIIMAIFILAPILAPLMGQGLIFLGGWRATFAGLILVALPSFLIHKPMRNPAKSEKTLRTVSFLTAFSRFRSRVTVSISTQGANWWAFHRLSRDCGRFFRTFTVSATCSLFSLPRIGFCYASLLNARLVMRHGMQARIHATMG